MFVPNISTGPPAFAPLPLNTIELAAVPTCMLASFFPALWFSFVFANTNATVRFGLPSGIGPVGIPNLLKFFTILAVERMAESPGRFAAEHPSNVLGICGNGG